jgi:hypothetical protein
VIEIDLGRCQHDPRPPDCAGLALREWTTLFPKYCDGVSVMALPDSMGDHFDSHKTFRKRVRRAVDRGYTVNVIEPMHVPVAIRRINESAPERQGRPMDDSYRNYRAATTPMPEVTCRLHHALFYGVFSSEEFAVLYGDQVGAMVGYASIYRCGDLVHVSQFLGHADFLDDGIMYFLLAEIMREQRNNGPGFLFYNRHDSGTDGLRFFKERIGLRAEDVAWIA